MKASDFGSDFRWGVSTAALQTEGFPDADGRMPSIWDTFAARRGKIRSGHHPQTACEFYRRFPEDIALASSLSIPNFRFSLSWPRIIPDGNGRINHKGLDHYKRLIERLKKHNIEPWITLYHWDLPQALEDKGGWTNRDVLGWFSHYAETAARELAGFDIPYWMVLNEPLAFTGAGYFLGHHAPGKKGFNNFLPAMLHAALATPAGEQAIRLHQPDAQIGSTYSCSMISPAGPSPAHIRAAEKADALLNRLFVEAALGMGFPFKELPFLRNVEKWMKADDEKNMISSPDFLGIQNYTREVVASCWYVPYLKAKIIKAKNRKVPHTEMNWEIYPDALYEMLRKFSAYRPGLPLVVTENGAAFPDKIEHNQVSDPERLLYLQEHIRRVRHAQESGIPVKGYFVWSLTDNFEWAEGYHPRFGLIYVDYKTQERTIKSSGHWFRDFLNSG